MSMNFKKALRKEFTYVPKDIGKHKHNYVIKCILEITNQNIHASCNNYGKKEYYNVLKCDVCNSFIPVTEEGIYSGWIFGDRKIDNSLPLIKASTNRKNLVYTFNDLYDVEVDKFQ